MTPPGNELQVTLPREVAEFIAANWSELPDEFDHPDLALIPGACRTALLVGQGGGEGGYSFCPCVNCQRQREDGSLTAPEASEGQADAEVARVADTAAKKIAAADEYWRNKLADTEQPFLALMDAVGEVTVDVPATGQKALDTFLEAESKAWKFLYGQRPNPRAATRGSSDEGHDHDAQATVSGPKPEPKCKVFDAKNIADSGATNRAESGLAAAEDRTEVLEGVLDVRQFGSWLGDELCLEDSLLRFDKERVRITIESAANNHTPSPDRKEDQ